MKRTLIQQHATGLIRGLIEQARAVDPVEHGHTKGVFRELFVTHVLRRYLTVQFGIGSGIVINQKGDQSNQTDIIIYDRRILPPFLEQEWLGIFPVEAVIATIEVKSRLRKADILEADNAAVRLRDVIAGPAGSIYREAHLPLAPGTAIVGFNDGGLGELFEEDRGKQWLSTNLRCAWAICLIQHFSWLRISDWSLQKSTDTSEETKRFIAVILDNIRTHAERNYRRLSERHHDWLGIYTRDNDAVRRVFVNRESERLISPSSTESPNGVE